MILQFVAALLGTGLLAFLMCTSDKTFELHYDKHGIFWACMAGLAVGMAEMLSFVVSGLGVPATQSIPIIIGGSVMFGAVLGLIILGEQLMLHGWSGIGLLVTGIVFVALGELFIVAVYINSTSSGTLALNIQTILRSRRKGRRRRRRC